MPTHKSNRFYLQIVPLLMSSSIGKREKTYALLDTESQSSLIREDFVRVLRLHEKKKKTNKIKISSIKDQGKASLSMKLI